MWDPASTGSVCWSLYYCLKHVQSTSQSMGLTAIQIWNLLRESHAKDIPETWGFKIQYVSEFSACCERQQRGMRLETTPQRFILYPDTYFLLELSQRGGQGWGVSTCSCPHTPSLLTPVLSVFHTSHFYSLQSSKFSMHLILTDSFSLCLQSSISHIQYTGLEHDHSRHKIHHILKI